MVAITEPNYFQVHSTFGPNNVTKVSNKFRDSRTSEFSALFLHEESYLYSLCISNMHDAASIYSVQANSIEDMLLLKTITKLPGIENFRPGKLQSDPQKGYQVYVDNRELSRGT